MSSFSVPSALDPYTQASPILTPAQISRIRSLSKLRRVAPGEILFEPAPLSAGRRERRPAIAAE